MVCIIYYPFLKLNVDLDNIVSLKLFMVQIGVNSEKKNMEVLSNDFIVSVKIKYCIWGVLIDVLLEKLSIKKSCLLWMVKSPNISFVVICLFLFQKDLEVRVFVVNTETKQRYNGPIVNLGKPLVGILDLWKPRRHPIECSDESKWLVSLEISTNTYRINESFLPIYHVYRYNIWKPPSMKLIC